MTAANRDPAWGGSGGGGAPVVPPVAELGDLNIPGNLFVTGTTRRKGGPVYDFAAYGEGTGQGSATADKAAMDAVLAAVPAYAAGQGGAVIEFPQGIFDPFNGSSQTIWTLARQGLTLRGQGSRSTLLRGTVAGPLITNDVGTMEVCNRLEGLYVLNLSADVAARAIQTFNMNELVLRDCVFDCPNGTGSASCAAQLDSTYDLLVEACQFQGANLDHCLRGTTQNVATYLRNSFRASKAGIRLATSTATNFLGNSFQTFTGSPTDGFGACINVAGCQDGVVLGNYLESCNTPFFTGTNGATSYGFDIRGNFITNPGGTAAIFLVGMAYAHVGPHQILPGANAVNINGVDMNGSDQCTVFQQRLTSGAGADRVRGTATNWVEHRNAYIEPRNSIVVLQKAGIPVDGDFSITPSNGTLAVDTTNNRLYVRIGGVWKSALVA